jgi:YD repeat-containing protein
VIETIIDPKRGPNWVSGADDKPTGLNLRTTYSYDAAGRTLSVTEGGGSAQPRITEYRYDSLGRRAQEIVDPGAGKLNLTTSYTYDANGNVVAKTDANGQVCRYVYDAANRLQFKVDATGAVETYGYDAEGRRTATTVYANRISLTSPTVLGNAISANDISARLSSSANDITTRTTYGKDGRAVFSLDGTGALLERVYDKNGNVIKSIAYTTRPTLSAYDLASVRTAANALPTTNNRITRAFYDAANRAAFSVDAEGYVSAFQYDQLGQAIGSVRYAVPSRWSMPIRSPRSRASSPQRSPRPQ